MIVFVLLAKQILQLLNVKLYMNQTIISNI